MLKLGCLRVDAGPILELILKVLLEKGQARLLLMDLSGLFA